MNRLRGLLAYPISRSNPNILGVLRKLEAQAAALTDLGADVTVAMGDAAGVLVDGHLHKYRVGLRGASYWEFYLRAASALTGRFDFAYIRFPFTQPAFLWFLRHLRRQNPGLVVVMEIPTYPYRYELRTPVQRVLGAVDAMLQPLLPKLVDVVVSLQGHTQIFGLRTVATANGVDVGAFPVARCADPNQERLSVVGLGYLADWHGYDRMIRALATPEGKSLTLTVIGDGPARSSLEALSVELGVHNRTEFTGILTGSSLDEALAGAHAGLGSLAEHRRGCAVATTLKVREFAARGIPFVYAAEDPDFPTAGGAWLQVSSTDAPLDATAVSAFARSNASIHVRAGLRAYAEQHLTWRAKLLPVMEVVRELHSSGRRS